MRLHVWIWCVDVWIWIEIWLKRRKTVNLEQTNNIHPVWAWICASAARAEASWSGFLLSEIPPGCLSPLVNTPRAKSSRHTKPEQIRCRVSSASAAESKAHHGAAGSRRAAGTHAAIACCVAVDGNDFCHVEAKDKLLLLQVRGGRLTWPFLPVRDCGPGPGTCG